MSIGASNPERCPKDIECEHFEAKILITLLACIWIGKLHVAESMMINNEEHTIKGIAHDHEDDAYHMSLEKPSNEVNSFWLCRTTCDEIKHCNWEGYVQLHICANNPASCIVVPKDSRTI